MKSYFDKTHTWGRIWTVAALIIFLLVPVAFSIHLNAWPKAEYFLKGLASVAIIFYPTAFIEVVSYAPLLGAAGTYMSFVTGNIANLKLPCTMSALETSGYSVSSEEGEVISTIAVAVSAMVTTIIIALGVLLMSVTGVIQKITSPSSPLYPAFQQILPCLFGAIGAVYFYKYWKITLAPLAVILALLAFNGGMQVGILIPVSVIVALVATHLMYKKGVFGKEEPAGETHE
ncbi:MAG: hypothetical protein IJI67_03350 [Clostridia bacterium]|nr:hypothetical protein [Clostridia bacterium]